MKLVVSNSTAGGLAANGYALGLNAIPNGGTPALSVTNAAQLLTQAACTKFAFLFANWALGANNTGTLSVKGYAFVRYDGTGFPFHYIPLTFGGSPSVTLQPGGVVASDPIAYPLGAGANVYAFCNYSLSGTTTYPCIDQGVHYEFGDTTGVHTDGTDPTPLSASSPSAFQPAPCALLTDAANLSSICGLGDSIMAGFGASSGGLFAQLARNIGAVLFSLGVGGVKAQDLAASGGADARYKLAAFCGWTIEQLGINDFSAGRTAAQAIADKLTIRTALAGTGTRVLQTTMTPHSTSTDGFVTTVNQTPDASAAAENGFNDAIRQLASDPYLAGVLDVAAAFETVTVYRPNPITAPPPIWLEASP